MLVVTRGFGNGSQTGSIAAACRRGYIAGAVVIPMIIDNINLVLRIKRSARMSLEIKTGLDIKLEG